MTDASQNARVTAHRAVTEGVNLRYVERLRQAAYAAADEIELWQRVMETAGTWEQFSSDLEAFRVGSEVLTR